jgi:hypothetical protein
MNISQAVKNRYFSVAEIVIIVFLACVPLFLTFPYRVNIFLSWEGAYRMSRGQLPFRDFGTPVGGMYWVIPGLFFKLFGPQMITLVKAQAFINIISGLAFRSILKSCRVRPGIKFVSVLLYCLSFSFFNFWPWYNHTVIVYEFVGLAFLLKALLSERNKFTLLWLMVSAFFTCCSFLTKQDAGGMAFMLSLALLFYACLKDKKWTPLLVYAGAFAGILFLVVAPFLKYNFGYWFNHGQAPHSGRISVFEIVDELLANSQWLKFYIFLIGMLLIMRFQHWKELWQQKREMIFLILTIGLLAEATIFQITSYTPPDNNIFYHSFAIVFILSMLADMSSVNFNGFKVITACCIGIMLWWSGVYWKYIQRIAERAFPPDKAVATANGENIVNKRTYIIYPTDTTDIPMSQWEFSPLKSFKNIYMPSATVAGISRILQMDLVKQHPNLRVLNMTELTPLAVEIPYALEAGPHYPLWYHLGVAMFNKQAEMFEKSIANKEYDLVLFEYIPNLNNFYPFRVRDSLLVNYRKIDSFPAPRRGETTKGMIEVFVK